MSGRFEGRRAVVTGSSRGIGAGIAERLAAEGANVVITARTLEKHDHLAGSLQETAKRLEQYGGTVIKTSLSEEDTKKLQEALQPPRTVGAGS